MKYKLETSTGPRPKRSLRESGKKFGPLFANEKGKFVGALIAIVLSSLATLIAPVLIVRIIDTEIRLKNFHGLVVWSLVVLAIYVAGWRGKLYPGSHHGRSRPAGAVQLAKCAVPEAARPAGGVLQREQGRRFDLATEQRYRQAESVCLAGVDAIRRQRGAHYRRGDFPGGYACQAWSGGIDARAGRAAVDARNVGVDQAQEPGKLAGAWAG